MATITAGVRDALINIYIGMFQVAPGATALSDMVASYESGKTQKQIAADLAATDGFKAAYPGLQLATEFADELVNWMAPEATSAGKSWATNWIVSQLNAGKSKSDIIVEASNALTASTNATDFGDAKAAHANRLEVARHYAVTNETSDDSSTALNGVTSDSSTVTTAIDSIDDPAVAGQTFTLTASVETVTGGDGNDTITAGTTLAGATTVNSGDSIAGGAGTDTLNLTATASANTSLSGLTVSGVEIVNIAGGNYIGGNAANIAAASTALAAAEAALALAASVDDATAAEDNAAVALDDAIVDVLASGAEADSAEDAIGWLTLASAAKVVSAKAALDYLEENGYTDYAEIDAVADLTAVPTGVTAFTLAEMKAAALATLTNANGSSNVNSDAGIDARLDDLIDEINVVVNYAQASGSTEARLDAVAAAYTAVGDTVEEADAAVTGAGIDAHTMAAGITSALQAQQMEDAYEAVLALADEDSAAAVAAVEAVATATVSPSDSFTLAQYKAAAAAVELTQAGAAITAVAAVTELTELQTVTFSALEPGQSVNVGGLRAFTTVYLNATEVAELFKGVSADATAGTETAGVTYSGTFGEGLDAEAANDGATLGFDGETAGVDVAAITLTSTGTAPTVVETTKGTAAVTAVTVAEAVAARAAVLDAAATDVNSEIGGGLAAGTFTVADVEAAVVGSSTNAVTGVALTTAANLESRAEALATDYAAYADAVESAGVTSWTFAELKAAASASIVSSTGASLITDANNSADIEARAEANVEATEAALTTSEADLAEASGADITATTEYDVQAAAATNGTIAASQFAGSTEIWLSGASNATNVTGITTQTIGLTSLTGLSSSLGFGATTGSIYSAASTGALTITGAATLNVAGTTGTLTLTAASTTALAVNMSGANSLTITSVGALESITVSGEGASTFTGTSATVETITSTDGAVTATISTATVVDNTATSADETVSAVVTTSDGADTITVSTTGAGLTTVTTGAGNDTIKLTRALGSNDTISAGSGNDTLQMAGKTFTAEDYTLLSSKVSGVEYISFDTSAVTVDASRLNMSKITNMVASGVISEASGVTLTTYKSLTASSTGYEVDDDDVTSFGGNLSVTLTNGYNGATQVNAGTSNLVLNGSANTVTVTPTSKGSITSTISGDSETLRVDMSNVAGTTADYTSTVTISVSATENEELTSVDLNGNGSVTINTSAAADGAIALATIDASGLGGTVKTGATTIGNISGGLTFTGNLYVAETISLGSGTDSVTINSTYENMDTVIGFDSSKETSTAKSTTDVIVFGGLTLDGSAEDEIAEIELSASATSLELALIEVAADAAGGVGDAATYFIYGGDTYLWKNQGAESFEDGDYLVKIAGVHALDTDWGVYSS